MPEQVFAALEAVLDHCRYDCCKQDLPVCWGRYEWEYKRKLLRAYLLVASWRAYPNADADTVRDSIACYARQWEELLGEAA
jgi:hypothetical protein